VNNPSEKLTRSATKLLFVAFGMFVFGFALVPLYDIICDVTGLNGKTAGKVVFDEEVIIDPERLVTIQFLASNNSGMPWEFRPANRSLKVQPGKLIATTFYARNPSGNTTTAQAVPSVTPSRAARYLHKTECFCFERQQLDGGESQDMPLRFIIDSELPRDISTVTLSYTLYDVTERADIAEVADVAKRSRL
jgi:cytochrome c oxidase assembly protein subunit 11